MTSIHSLFLKILLSGGRIIFEAEHVYLLACFVHSFVEDDLEGPKNFLVGEVPIRLHYVQVGGDFVNGLGARGFSNVVRKRRSFGGVDIVGLLVLGQIGPGGGPSLNPRVVSCGAPNFVANKTFVISDVFCPLDWGKIDPVNVHCHRIPRVLSGSGRGWKVSGSASEFPHSDSCIIELTSLVEPKFVVLWFFE